MERLPGCFIAYAGRLPARRQRLEVRKSSTRKELLSSVFEYAFCDLKQRTQKSPAGDNFPAGLIVLFGFFLFGFFLFGLLSSACGNGCDLFAGFGQCAVHDIFAANGVVDMDEFHVGDAHQAERAAEQWVL